jgi:hypothetical protein
VNGAYLGETGTFGTNNAFCRFDFSTPSPSNACPSGWSRYRKYNAAASDPTKCKASLTLASDPYGPTNPCGNSVSKQTTYNAPGGDTVVVNANIGMTVNYGIQYYGIFADAVGVSSPIPSANTYTPTCGMGGGASMRWDRYRILDDILGCLIPSAEAFVSCDFPNTVYCQAAQSNQTCDLVQYFQLGCY